MPLTRRELISGAAATAAAALTDFGRLGRAIAQEGETLTIATPADVLSWDPIAHVHSTAMPLYRSVFDSPLIQSSDHLKIVPNVISAWKWADEGNTLELTFRDDVVFHNGDKLTAEDFKFTYFDRLQEDKKLALAGIFGETISSIEVKSPTEAVVHLKRVMPMALNWFTSLANFIMPKDYFTKLGREAFLKKPIGSGPYELVDYQQGSRLVLKAFDRYWNGAPKIKNLVFEVVKEPSARVAAIQSGNADFATGLPIREVQRLETVAGLTGEIKPITAVISVLVRDIGVFQDENVRMAAHLAINKAALSKAFSAGKAEVLSVPGVPTMPGYDSEFTIPYDPDRALELLKGAGFGPGSPASITFYSTNGVQPNDWEMARAIAGMWAQVGIEAKLEPMEVAKYFELNAAGKLPEATFWYWVGPGNDPEQFAGTLLNPDSRFSVIKRDDLRTKLEPLLREFDQEKRIAGYREVDRYAVENAYIIPLLQGTNGIAFKDNLRFQWFENGWYEPYRIEKA